MTKQDIPVEESPGRPLVVTLKMDSSAETYFNELRKQHFPPERNYLYAHLTLFHALPDLPWVIDGFIALAKEQKPFEVTAEKVISLGGGTAFKILSPQLAAMHQTLRKQWFDFLTPQDKQKRNFHITVQNKVEHQSAKKLQSELSQTFEPFSFTISGIHVWRYLGGPWEHLTTIDFGK